MRQTQSGCSTCMASTAFLFLCFWERLLLFLFAFYFLKGIIKFSNCLNYDFNLIFLIQLISFQDNKINKDKITVQTKVLQQSLRHLPKHFHLCLTNFLIPHNPISFVEFAADDLKYHLILCVNFL
jgi:hypothetical protein